MLKGFLAATLLALQLASLGSPLLCDRGGHGETEGCVEAVPITSIPYIAVTPDAPAGCPDCARPDCTRMMTCTSVVHTLVSDHSSVLPMLEDSGTYPERDRSDPDRLTRPLAPPPRI